MPHSDPIAVESDPTIWGAVPVDGAAVYPPAPPAPGDAYAAFLAAIEDYPVAPFLSVERTDVG